MVECIRNACKMRWTYTRTAQACPVQVKIDFSYDSFSLLGLSSAGPVSVVVSIYVPYAPGLHLDYSRISRQ